MRSINIFVLVLPLAVSGYAACAEKLKISSLCNVNINLPSTTKTLPPETNDCLYSTYNPEGEIFVYDFPLDQYLKSEFSKYQLISGRLKLIYQPTVKDNRNFYYLGKQEYFLNLAKDHNFYYGLRQITYTETISEIDIVKRKYCVDLLHEQNTKTLDFGFCFKSLGAAKQFLNRFKSQYL